MAGDFNGDGRTRPGRRERTGIDSTATAPRHGVGAAGQRRRHLPAPGHLRGGVRPDRARGGRLQRRRPHRPGRREPWTTTTVSVLLGNGDGTFQPQVDVRGGACPGRARGGRLQRRRPPRPGRRQRAAPTTSRCCWATATAPSSPRPVRHDPSCHAPGGRRQRRRHRRCAGGRRAGDILYRQGSPGEPGSFEPPVTINPGIPVARHRLGPQDRSRPRARQRRRPTTRSRSTPTATAASSGRLARHRPLCRRRSSRPTSTATAGTTWSSATPATAPSRSIPERRRRPAFRRAAPADFLPPSTLPVGLGVSDVQAVDTTGSGTLDLVVTNKLTGQVEHPAEPGRRDLRTARALSRRDRACPRSTPHRLARGHQPGSDGGRGRRAVHAGRPDRPGDDQPRLEHPRPARRPGARPVRQSRRPPDRRARRRSSAWPTSITTASRTWPSSAPRA